MTDNPYRTLDRRRWPRIDTLGLVTARLVGNDAELVVSDLSSGGCALIARTAMEVGTKHQIDFTCRRRVHARLLTEVVSCRPLGENRFQVGCRFMNADHPRVQALSGALLDAAMDLRFDVSEVD